MCARVGCHWLSVGDSPIGDVFCAHVTEKGERAQPGERERESERAAETESEGRTCWRRRHVDTDANDGCPMRFIPLTYIRSRPRMAHAALRRVEGRLARRGDRSFQPLR